MLAKIVNANFLHSETETSQMLVCTATLSGFLTRVKGEVRARDGIGDGFRVRDRASVNAKARGGFG